MRGISAAYCTSLILIVTYYLLIPFYYWLSFSTSAINLTPQIHGFTGSSQVWKKNIPSFSDEHRVIVPDLRGHGEESDKPKHGYHVSRLAMDLRELLIHLEPAIQEGKSEGWKAIGGSLGCSILWCVLCFPCLEFILDDTLGIDLLISSGAMLRYSPQSPSRA